jgi:hypothetical protein
LASFQACRTSSIRLLRGEAAWAALMLFSPDPPKMVEGSRLSRLPWW